MDRRSFVTGLGGVTLFNAVSPAIPSALAATNDNPGLSPEDVDAVQQVSRYMSSIINMRGLFQQVDPKGNISDGVFHIAKPGKMRFEYNAPNPFLIIADGKWLLVRNRRRGKTDKYPLDGTPLRFVLADEVDLMRDSLIRHVVHKQGITTVALKARDKLTVGNLVLTFDANENRLQQWVVIDPQGRRTTVSLSAIETDFDPDPELFATTWQDRNERRQDNR